MAEPTWVKLKVIRNWTKPSGVFVRAGTVLEVKDFSAEALLRDYPKVFEVVNEKEADKEGTDK